MPLNSIVCAGIDTGKESLMVCVGSRADGSAPGPAAMKEFANTPCAYPALIDWLREHGVTRVGIEATGVYSRPVTAALRAADTAVVVFQPNQVAAYGRWLLKRHKNDPVDAALIATCAEQVETVRPAPDERLDSWADDLTWIEQLEADRAQLKTRLESHRKARIRAEIEHRIDLLHREIKAEQCRLIEDIRRHDDLGRRFDLIGSVDGIGPRTALAILIRLPEIDRLTREQAASLAGLAPFDDDSGGRHGKRRIAGGRARLRRALYAAALPAAFKWNPALVSLYQRLKEKGKGHKQALVACARKLLIYAVTVVQRGTPWQKNIIAEGNGCSG